MRVKHLPLNQLLPRPISNPFLEETLLQLLPKQHQIFLKLDLILYASLPQVDAENLLIELRKCHFSEIGPGLAEFLRS